MRFLNKLVAPCLLGILLALGGMQAYVAHADAVHLYPAKNDFYDLGKAGLEWRNETVGNITVTGINIHNGLTKVTPTTVITNTTFTVANSSLIFVGNGMNNATTLTLPSAVLAGAGATYVVQDTGGNVTVNGNLTINATVGNINGGASLVLNNTTYERAILTSDGGNYTGVVIGKIKVN